MTRGTWIAILLLVAGVAVLIFQPQLRSCVTDYDVTVCETSGIIGFNIAGAVLVLLGSGLAIAGHLATHPDPGEDTGEAPPTP